MPTNLDITYVEKELYAANPLADKYKCTYNDMNELKAKHNALCAAIEQFCKQTIVVFFGAVDFSGNYYQNSNLVDLTTDDFLLFSNDGSGVLINPDDFTFAPATGRITIAIGNYVLQINKPITLPTV